MKLKPADFARQAGVTRQSVGAKIKNKTLIIDAAGYLDTDNPINAAYISDPERKSRREAHSKPVAPPGDFNLPIPASKLAPAQVSPALETEEDIAGAAGVPAELLSLTLRELVIKYNGIYNLEKHAKTLQYIMSTAEKDQRIQERSLKLIEKDFVTSRLFQFVDTLMKQLIEYPEATIDSIIAKIQSDGAAAREELVVMIRNGLGKVISGAKEQIVSELNGLKGKYNEIDKFEDINEAIKEAMAGE
jgi:hypothetical protein